jgi:hypothetical protein
MTQAHAWWQETSIPSHIDLSVRLHVLEGIRERDSFGKSSSDFLAEVT